jgi:branched-chain amino acid transport system substrate-binding protein
LVVHLLNSKALAKIQSAALIAIIVVAAVVGGIAYILLNGEEQSADTIKLGVCADIDGSAVKVIWQEAVLAAEQVNAEGGVLGRNFEIVAEDDDDESPSLDIATATNAFTRLITVDEPDYVIYSGLGGLSTSFLEFALDHKIIFFNVYDPADELSQRVLDNYEEYKYFFRVGTPNATSSGEGFPDTIRVLRGYTGFNKVAFVSNQLPGQKDPNAVVIENLLQYVLKLSIMFRFL